MEEIAVIFKGITLAQKIAAYFGLIDSVNSDVKNCCIKNLRRRFWHLNMHQLQIMKINKLHILMMLVLLF